MKQRYIVHLDMDAFFASIEERDNPLLRGKPVIIGADPKAGRGRGVVSTCSYAAREYGVRSAMPISVAYGKCPHGVFLAPDMEKYSRVSEEIFEILSAFTPQIEPVSIDEVFLDISDTYHLFGSAVDACRLMKERVKKETGLTASLGLAPGKMAAKIASGLKKPDGFVEVKREELLRFLEPLDVNLLWGVGIKTNNAMASAGIYTIGDLAKRTKEDLEEIFGKNGAWFWAISHGIDTSEVVAEHEIKSISNETTFEKDTSDKRCVERELSWLCELVSDRLRKQGFKCRTLSLKIRLSGFQTYRRSKTFCEPTNFSEDMMGIIKALYHDFDTRYKKVRLVGVRASNFSQTYEPTLFEAESDGKRESVHKAIDKIRWKFGRTSISRACSRP